MIIKNYLYKITNQKSEIKMIIIINYKKWE